MESNQATPQLTARELERLLEAENQAGYLTGRHRALQELDRRPRTVGFTAAVAFCVGVLIGVLI
ncbi:MAG: hypothetical protein M3Y79_09270 [Pseudomonadota bacterium]|nr:hypothetical protein [Pseudomonadota bacterium]